jgi:hypothetical protein
VIGDLWMAKIAGDVERGLTAIVARVQRGAVCD